MDIKELRDTYAKVGLAAILGENGISPIILRALDALIATEESTDEIVRELRDIPHGFDRNSSHTEDRYVCMCEHLADKAAAALVAMKDKLAARDSQIAQMHLGARAYKERAEKAEAERDSLKRHAEAMAFVAEEYWNRCENSRAMLDALDKLDEAITAYRRDHPKEEA